MKVERNYVHRAFGTIGAVALEAPEGEWRLDGKVLPASSVEHLVTFALQTLQDAYAGAKDVEEAKAFFGKKYERLVEGTLGVRSGGGTDPLTAEMRRLCRNAIKAKLGAERAKSATDEELDAVIKKNHAAFEAAAKKELARKEAERKRKAEIASGLTIDL